MHKKVNILTLIQNIFAKFTQASALIEFALHLSKLH